MHGVSCGPGHKCHQEGSPSLSWGACSMLELPGMSPSDSRGPEPWTGVGALDRKAFLQETEGTHLAVRESQTGFPGLRSLWPALYLLSSLQSSCCCHGHKKPRVKCPLATAGYQVGWRPPSSTQEMGGGLPWPAD